MLPASPKMFHGREFELDIIIGILGDDSVRAVILGPGGMGKTTLAAAALHHPTTVDKYEHRHFITCESANTPADLLSIVGSYLGLEPSRQLSKAIVQHFKQCGPSLVVLDNLKTCWEPLQGRAAIEEFLSLLTDVPSLSLLITMRGAERPGKVKWSRPFLPALEPLSLLASRQIFADVADEPLAEDGAALDELLNLSGCLPLAVSLMANIVSFEGYSGAFSRWKVESTGLFFDGHDKRSNLDISIELSLGSPRISSSPHAKDLLSLISLLPDGIREEDLLLSESRTSLLRTSLAYIDGAGRLKMLSPLREYIRREYPPSIALFQPLLKYFQQLLGLWNSYFLLAISYLDSLPMLGTSTTSWLKPCGQRIQQLVWISGGAYSA
ncbi:P-loop containing nucleoside triphosphate hydrolase protein [Mycena crocata]|nr:P-loop containing nucleoside triphosphate hydrolase protein [Mycena crocata]